MGINYQLSMALLEGDGIPVAFCVDATFTSWVCRFINTPCLANVTPTTFTTNTSLMMPWTLKQTRQYNKYCMSNLKPEIQMKLSMALLEFINHESILIHGTT